jgi:hypothetical protein
MPTDTKTARFTIRVSGATMSALVATSTRKGLHIAEYAREALEARLAADAPKVAGMNLNTRPATAESLAVLVTQMPPGSDVIGWLLANQGPRA